MSYAAPALTVAVTLQTGYAAPEVGSVVLGGGIPVDAVGRVALAPTAPVVDVTIDAEIGLPAQVTAALPAPAPALTVRADAAAYTPLAYSAPSLSAPVVLAAGHTPPAITDPVVLVSGAASAPTVDAVVAAALVPVVPGIGVAVQALVGLPARAEVALPPGMPAVTLTALAAPVLPARIAGSLAALVPPMALMAGVAQDVALHDADGVRAAAPHAHRQPAAAGAATAQQQMATTASAGRTLHAHALPVGCAARTAHASAAPLRRASRQHHRHGAPLAHGSSSLHASGLPLRRPARAPHAHAQPLCHGAAARHTSTLRPGRLLDAPHRHGTPIGKPQRAGHHQAEPTATRLKLRWQHGDLPLPGRWWPWYEPPGLTIVLDADAYTPRPLRCRVVLGPGYAIQPPCPIEPGKTTFVIPTKRTYIVINEVTLRRTDSNTAVQALSLDIAIDADSWLPTWSAEVAFSEWPALAAQNGDALEIEATINGHRWLLLAEGAPARSRSFGKTTVRIRGRGIAAWLDAPSAEEVSHFNASQMTAQQLMAQALTTNGVSLGWGVDWQIDDWLVPAGAWSVQGTPIAGVLDVASAVRAVVQADPVSKTLHVLPRYPAAPWNWGSLTPDIEIPPDIILTDSLEPVSKTGYNAVYVSGQTCGVIRRVVRTGTAGDVLAPMVTHPLITEAVAGRQRGLVELSDTGRQARVSISLPISADTSLLKVGQLACLTETGDAWRGLVRSVGVSARWNGDSGLTVAQTAELERRYL